MKNIFRWTVGPVSINGLEILQYSIKNAMRLFGNESFNWIICYNNLNNKQLNFVKKLSIKFNLNLFEQKWNSCPITEEESHYINDEKPIGSLWKICPPRINMNTYEIICDNDLILTKIPQEIKDFLSGDNTMILEDPIRYYGNYNIHICELKLNTGLIGLPPHYNFGENILKIKNKYNKKILTNGCEQGLLVATLLETSTPIIISKNNIIELHHNFFTNGSERKNLYVFTDTEYGFHFVGANRKKEHIHWIKFKNKNILL